MKTRGFSLIEMMVAVAIAGIVAASAVMVTGQIIKNIRDTERLVQSYDRAKTLVDYMITFLQPIGGGGLRPWAVVEVVDNADVTPSFTRPTGTKVGTDVLRIFEQDPELDECGLIARSGNKFSSDNTTCCLTSDHGNRISTILSGDGRNWDTFMSGTVDTANCTIEYAPATSVSKELPNPTNASIFVNGSIAPTRERIFYLNEDNELHMMIDSDGNGSAEDFLVAPNVADLQFSKGYDVDGDGTLDEDGSSNDEWSNNGATGSFEDRGSAGTRLETAQHNQLRMILLAITVRSSRRGTTSESTVLNGKQISEANSRLRTTTSRAYFRNLNIFQ